MEPAMTDSSPSTPMATAVEAPARPGARSGTVQAVAPVLTPTQADRQRALRAALGEFATGVTVVTACDATGRPIGVTVNSLASASLDPPLVLWSLARASASRCAYESALHHGVNVLAVEQDAIARRFAARGLDRFAGIDFHAGPFGVPLIDGALAHLVLARREVRETGDHRTFVGEVVFHQRFPRAPLVFHRSCFCATRAQSGDGAPRVANG
jgi:unspecific monooxygenase